MLSAESVCDSMLIFVMLVCIAGHPRVLGLFKRAAEQPDANPYLMDGRTGSSEAYFSLASAGTIWEGMWLDGVRVGGLPKFYHILVYLFLTCAVFFRAV